MNRNIANSKVTFTEVALKKEDDLPRILIAAREYASWEKINGKWPYTRRHTYAGTTPPA